MHPSQKQRVPFASLIFVKKQVLTLSITENGTDGAKLVHKCKALQPTKKFLPVFLKIRLNLQINILFGWTDLGLRGLMLKMMAITIYTLSTVQVDQKPLTLCTLIMVTARFFRKQKHVACLMTAKAWQFQLQIMTTTVFPTWWSWTLVTLFCFTTTATVLFQM